jgi:hypothetical protein
MLVPPILAAKKADIPPINGLSPSNPEVLWEQPSSQGFFFLSFFDGGFKIDWSLTDATWARSANTS